MSTDNLNFGFKMNKIEATKYILKGLCDWYYELNPSKKEKDNNDLSILKVLKLIFFLSTVSHEGNTLLGNPFDNFKAMPLGPVESDVYQYFKRSTDTINYTKTIYKSVQNSDLVSEEKELIDTLINKLRTKNNDLINKSAFYLVDLTHEWTCWINNYNKAELQKVNSIDLPIKDIQESKEKVYTF